MKKIPSDMIAGTIHKTNNFGNLKIVDYISAMSVIVEFLDTGFKTKSRSEHIRLGRVKDKILPTICGIGFIGDGEFPSSIERKHTKSYKAWSHMIERCYDHRVQEKQPTYKGCTVDREWHNFQNFAKWYHENNPDINGDYEVDKDIKFSGNKIYSKDTCIFASKSSNIIKAAAKRYKFKSPDGDIVGIYNLREFCRNMDLCGSKMSAVNNGKRKHHKGWTRVN